MSVIFAPRARMAVKASWPGVSRKVTFWPPASVDLISADMLGDAAGFFRRDIGLAQGIKQRGFAVIDMAHDGDNRRTRLRDCRIVFFVIGQDVFDVAFGDALEFMAEFADHQLGRIGVDGLRGGDHHAEFHQHFDDIDGALGHAVGQFLHGNGFGNNDVADDFFGFLRGRPALF